MARMLEQVGRDLETAHHYLGQLDAALGDGDHGVSMTIGVRAVRKALAAHQCETVAELLQQTGAVFQGAAGATVGALLGTALANAAGVLKDREPLTAKDMAAAFRAALDAVTRLGGAQPGDKTLVDCLHPAVVAIEKAVAEGCDALSAFDRGVEAGKHGMESTRDLLARKGRASRLGERTRGHVDPGAASCFLILQSAHAFLRAQAAT